jgi:hypothetical protein
MKKITLLSVVLVIISLVAIFGTSVQAAAPSNGSYNSAEVQNLYEKMVQAKNQNIDTFLSQLSPEDQQLAIKILTPVSVEMANDKSISSLIRPMDSGLVLNTYVTYYDIFHIAICRYLQQITWYYNGTYITQPPQRITGGTTSLPGWTYNGISSQYDYGGQGYTYYEGYSQASFSLTVGGIVVQTWYPWIDQTVYGNGTYSVSTS